MCVDDNEQGTRATHSERDETLLPNGILVLAGQRVLVYQYGGCFGEGNAMLSYVRLCLLWIPLDFHRAKCMDKCLLSQGLNDAVSGLNDAGMSRGALCGLTFDMSGTQRQAV